MQWAMYCLPLLLLALACWEAAAMAFSRAWREETGLTLTVELSRDRPGERGVRDSLGGCIGTGIVIVLLN